MVDKTRMPEEITRRLATIVMADVVGYSRLMGADERGTHARVQSVLRDLIEPALVEHHGRLVKQRGDGFLSMFDSPVEAVRCAIIIQQGMVRRNLEMPSDQAIRLRIGINLGDVIVEPDDIYGDGVNIAARLEELAEPGNIFISGGVYEQVRYKLICGFQSLGERRVKNIVNPVSLYRVLANPVDQERVETRRRTLLYGGLIAATILGIGGGYFAYESLTKPSPARPAVEAQSNPPPVPQPQREAVANPPPPPAIITPPAPEVVPRPAVVAEKPPEPVPLPPPLPTLPEQPVATIPLRAPPQPIQPPPEPPPDLPIFSTPDMVSIPGGNFNMGSNDDPSEQPMHRVTVRPFLLSKYPVTAHQWLACALVKSCSYTPTADNDAPVTNLSWNDTKEYVTWLSQITGKTYRLPTEAEWEYAARGGTETRYWWGNTMKPGLATCKGCGDTKLPTKVGSRPANPFGLYDINGGIAEWTEDCWFRDYKGAPTDGAARSKSGCQDYVLRGGAWTNDQNDVRPASRDFYNAAVRYPTHGLRVARSLP